MPAYAECRSCRREVLLRYFGESYSGPCDNCEAAGIVKLNSTAAHLAMAGQPRR